MARHATQSLKYKPLALLSRLVLGGSGAAQSFEKKDELKDDILNLSKSEFDELVSLANPNHVIVRGLEAFLSVMRETGDDSRSEWAEAALAVERVRIARAIPFLKAICSAFEDHGYEVAVIKSLDHWPDLGSDLDLYTDSGSEDVCKLMKSYFGAKIEPRSWGDRLAGKWNFAIPGLPELVEIHMGRLGQTGEQTAIASSLFKRTGFVRVDGCTFRVPSVSDRLLISTLQRMYRHFYFRLCDVIDSAALADSGQIDYDDLRFSASAAGIWEGVATYLLIVSNYVKSYRGAGIDLPRSVVDAARFGGDAIYFNRGFLRVPIMPQSARLYGSQLMGMLRKQELTGGARLSLLPWLATAAVVGQKITGSDKGIW
jgi:hypothetical protein